MKSGGRSKLYTSVLFKITDHFLSHRSDESEKSGEPIAICPCKIAKTKKKAKYLLRFLGIHQTNLHNAQGVVHK